MKRFICLLSALLIIAGCIPVSAEEGAHDMRIIFTHDIHSYFDISTATIDGKVRERGGAARLATVIRENTNDCSVYLDGGDFSMGTLMMAGFTTHAFELRLLGELGCAATTFGNHEFDFDGYGTAKMLRAAMAADTPLPLIIQSNMVTDVISTDEQNTLVSAMKDYGVLKYTVLDVGECRMALFGLLGPDGIEYSPTSGMEFTNYIECAKKTVAEIKKNTDADIIVCLSHCGTKGDGKTGEDFDLARAVPDIDVIISGHSHSSYTEPCTVGNTVIVLAGEYLSYVGVLDLSVGDEVKVKDYRLVPCDETVESDPAIAAEVDGFKEIIRDTYLNSGTHGDSSPDVLLGAQKKQIGYDDVLCKCDFDFISLTEMYETHGEYPLGDLIADSYMYEAKQNGIDDIDVSLVGLGTIRGTLYKGDVTVSRAFEICSLGIGSDGSAGHPLVGAYMTGKELKLLLELDASLGPMINEIKMSYAGLRYTFNEKRLPLNRVIEAKIVRADGTEEEIEDGKLYKAACNMYAVNMLGMLNGLTKGILSIVPKYADGTPVEDLYTCSLMNTEGEEIKEWIAFRDYLASMPEKDGVPTIPERYSAPDGRKVKLSEGGLAVIKDPGALTVTALAVPGAVVALIIVLIATRKKRKAKRAARKAAKTKKKEDTV